MYIIKVKRVLGAMVAYIVTNGSPDVITVAIDVFVIAYD